VVTNSLFMLGGAFLLGGLRHHAQEFNRANARIQTGMLLLATIALLIPSAVGQIDRLDIPSYAQPLSLSLSVILLVTYALSLVFSLKTHRDFFASAGEGGHGEEAWPLPVALGALAVTTVFIALVSEIFVESVQHAALELGMSRAFVGFIVVSLVGAAAEIASAFSGARKNRLDLSVGIALGSSAQIALFVAPVLVLLSRLVGPAELYLTFGRAELGALFLAVLLGAIVTGDGKGNWFKGVQLLVVYAAIASMFYFMPEVQ
jgi:Ca2+:H+ antiporter